MADAISNLGGGGLSSPYLANLANSLNYASGCMVTLIGGPLINKFGIKWSCMIAAVAMPLSGSAYYVNAKYGVDWYLLFSNASYRHLPCLRVLSLMVNLIDPGRIHLRLPLRRRDDRHVVVPVSK